MLGLLHQLLLCVVACVGSVQIYELCPGTPFYLPRPPEYDPETSDLSFTPQSPPAKPLVVLKKTEPTDDRYQFRNRTLFISELREADAGTFSWEKDGNVHTILRLAIKDCAERFFFRVGQTMELVIPPTAVTLEFVPLSSPDAKEVLWSSSSSGSVNPRAYVQGSHWYLQYLAPTDSGFYTFRRQSGADISKTQLAVKANMYYINIDQEPDWEVPVPIPESKISLVYLSPSGLEFLIIQNGRRTEEAFLIFRDRVELYEEEPGYGHGHGHVFTLSDTQRSDEGTYKILDRDGHLLALTILATNPPSSSVYWWALVPVAVLLVLLLVCVCRRCRKE